MDWHGELHDISGLSLLLRFQVTLSHVHAFDDDAIEFWKHLEHLACLAFVFSSEDFDRITGLDVEFYHSSYTTSGAKEIILAYPLLRNSRAIGPKIRVPFGSFVFLSIITAALSSKRT